MVLRLRRWDIKCQDLALVLLRCLLGYQREVLTEHRLPLGKHEVAAVFVSLLNCLHLNRLLWLLVASALRSNFEVCVR